MAAQTILVTGATGKQGGSLTKALLKKHHHVRALTRKPDSPGAQALARMGAQVVQGDFSRPETLVAAARGVDAMFAMSTPFESGTDAETKQGIAVANAAKDAGVPYLVFTSVASADRRTGIPHFESKFAVEEHIKRLGIRHCIIAPVFFMENLTSPWWLPGLAQGQLAMAMPADRPLQQIALENIGQFGALVLERPDHFAGQRVDLASDELPGSTAAAVISRVSGRPIRFVQLSLDQLRAANPDFASMFEWFDRVGYSADLTRLRAAYPEVSWLRFDEWALRQDWRGMLGAQ